MEFEHVPWEGWLYELKEKFVPPHVQSKLMTEFDTFRMTDGMTTILASTS